MIPGRSLTPLRNDLRERVFRLDAPPLHDRMGLEVEYLVRDRATGDPVRLEGPAGVLARVAELAVERSWTPAISDGAAPRWEAPCGCAVTFEPGGQIEVASPPVASVDAVFECMDQVAAPLRTRLAALDWALLSSAIDPVHHEDRIELELRAPRYLRMAEHFRPLGPAGRRMMRQTASVHINVDLGSDPAARWRVANALTPVLTAVFANSSTYRDGPSGFRNFRAWQWRTLDPLRTGAVGQGAADPVAEYLRFALAAPAILAGSSTQQAEPFEVWWERTGDMEMWFEHLSTLFPEVRPRGYLEIRSVDLLPDRWLPVPVAFVVGILYAEPALAEAERRLPPASEDLLKRAARVGLADDRVLGAAEVAWRLALEGMAERPDVISEPVRELAAEFYETFTRRGRDPGSRVPSRRESVESVS